MFHHLPTFHPSWSSSWDFRLIHRDPFFFMSYDVDNMISTMDVDNMISTKDVDNMISTKDVDNMISTIDVYAQFSNSRLERELRMDNQRWNFINPAVPRTDAFLRCSIDCGPSLQFHGLQASLDVPRTESFPRWSLVWRPLSLFHWLKASLAVPWTGFYGTAKVEAMKFLKFGSTALRRTNDDE